MSLSEAAIPALQHAERQQATTRFIISLVVVLIIIAIVAGIIYAAIYAKEQSIDIDPFNN